MPDSESLPEFGSAAPGLLGGLHSLPPSQEQARQMALFGQFIGSWHLSWTGQGVHGEPVRLDGELHVGWVLGSRAVQDVWIVPGRGHPREGQAPGFHGTTVRFPDPHSDPAGQDGPRSWHSIWIDPPNGVVRRFSAHPDGPDIELISYDDQPWLRWRFTDIRADTFTWTGETSSDNTTWASHQHVLATRTTLKG